MDKAKKKAIHDDVRDSSIPEEMKLMYLTASACQSIVERVFQRIKNVYARHGYICDENELLSGLNEYCKTIKRASNVFYERINPQIEKATWGIGRSEDDDEGNILAYDGFNGAACELVRLMMLHIDRTANDDKAYSQVFRTLRKLPSKGVFDDKDVSRYKLKV